MSVDLRDKALMFSAGLVGHCQHVPRLLDLTDNDRAALQAWIDAMNQHCDKVVEAINAASRGFEGRTR